ncbi:MAG TPA: hypothetical protein VEW93_08300 [Acidimicrobiales bacterium]|nr:hypothetical protein [Acidimicrobiales bacterium]
MIHARARAPHLAVLRVTVFGIWFVTVAQLRVRQFATIPPELVQPPGLLRALPLEELLARPNLLQVLQVVALVGCTLAVAGVRPFPVVALPTVAVLFVLDGAMKSVGGFTNHAQTAVLYAAGILAVFPAADAWSVARRPAPDRRSPWLHRAPLVLSTLVITTAYTMIGLRRLVDGGLSLVTGASVETWLVSRSLEYGRYPFDDGLLVLEHRWLLGLAVAGMALTTCFESLSLLTLRSDRFRLVWLAVIVPFHVVTLFAMRIFFWENLILVVVLLTGLPDRLVGLVERRRAPAGRAPLNRAPANRAAARQSSAPSQPSLRSRSQRLTSMARSSSVHSNSRSPT